MLKIVVNKSDVEVDAEGLTTEILAELTEATLEVIKELQKGQKEYNLKELFIYALNSIK